VATHKIVATETKKVAKVTKAKKVQKPIDPTKPASKNVFVKIGGYFKGAWFELREVRWPNRKATWSLTLAVLAFVLFFTLLVTLLDALYKYLFELILK